MKSRQFAGGPGTRTIRTIRQSDIASTNEHAKGGEVLL